MYVCFFLSFFFSFTYISCVTVMVDPLMYRCHDSEVRGWVWGGEGVIYQVMCRILSFSLLFVCLLFSSHQSLRNGPSPWIVYCHCRGRTARGNNKDAVFHCLLFVLFCFLFLIGICVKKRKGKWGGRGWTRLLFPLSGSTKQANVIVWKWCLFLVHCGRASWQAIFMSETKCSIVFLESSHFGFLLWPWREEALGRAPFSLQSRLHVSPRIETHIASSLPRFLDASDRLGDTKNVARPPLCLLTMN